ncbi:hypothetical protein GN156_00405 [bacterium LRH843]|nr:hypothetical protein [bacterium LRH843]
MGTLLELLGSIGTLIISFMKDISEEKIDKNIKFLKRYEWFQEYFGNEQYKKLITENDDVRYIIGKLNTDKMEKVSYQKKYKKKIAKLLLKKSANLKSP